MDRGIPKGKAAVATRRCKQTTRDSRLWGTKLQKSSEDTSI